MADLGREPLAVPRAGNGRQREPDGDAFRELRKRGFDLFDAFAAEFDDQFGDARDVAAGERGEQRGGLVGLEQERRGIQNVERRMLNIEGKTVDGLFNVLFAGGAKGLFEGEGQVAAEGVELRDRNEEGGAFVGKLVQLERRIAQLGERGSEGGRHGVGIFGGGERTFEDGRRGESGPVGFGAGKGLGTGFGKR